jgi:hypothetical protein
MFRIVFWDVTPCKIIVDYYFTRRYIPEDNSEHHTVMESGIVRKPAKKRKECFIVSYLYEVHKTDAPCGGWD